MNKDLDIYNLMDLLEENLSDAEINSSDILVKASAKISQCRLNLNMNQSEFAEFLGISQGLVSKWESSCYNFTIEKLCDIFDKLGYRISVHFFPKNSIDSVNSDMYWGTTSNAINNKFIGVEALNTSSYALSPIHNTTWRQKYVNLF